MNGERVSNFKVIMAGATATLSASCGGCADHQGGCTSGGARPVSGVALENIDSSVRPQDGLFQYANGRWLARTEIPAENTSWGAFNEVLDLTQQQLKEIVEAKLPADADAGHRMVVDFHRSFMDEEAVERRGLSPLAAEMEQIDGLVRTDQVHALMARFTRMGFGDGMPFYVGVLQDAKNATRYTAGLSQGGLGLPDRSFYLEAALAPLLDHYQAHVQAILALAGQQDAQQQAAAVVALETALARAQWTPLDNRDPAKTYNRRDLSALPALLPVFQWDLYLAASGISGKADSIVVFQPSYLQGLEDVFVRTPLSAWKAYFRWHLLHAAAPFLPDGFVRENFTFYGTVLAGTPALQPRWKRALTAVDPLLGEALGKLYVEKRFPAESKTRTLPMVDRLREAYRASIHRQDWLGAQSKARALLKLDNMAVKIGYPDVWRDYGGLEIRADDLWGNVVRSHRFDYDRQLRKLDGPVDRQEWLLSPQTVNAYYNPMANEIVFPAAILQKPFFDPAADDAVNFGAIGSIIGHEMSHAFDDQGSKFDENGTLSEWWSPAERSAYTERTRTLVAQYGQYSPVPGALLNGEFTLGENIADNAGVSIAFQAYQTALQSGVRQQLDGFTDAQRFYLGLANAFRLKVREGEARRRLNIDPHAPAEFRVDGSARNQPGFDEAYGLVPTDRLYVPPAQRFSLW